MTSTSRAPTPQTDLNDPRLQALTAPQRIEWGLRHFPRNAVIASTSFGVESAVLLHLVSRIAPGLRVIFIDTGYHFPETLAFKDALVRRLRLNLHTVRAPDPEIARRPGQPWGMVARPRNWCHCRKVEAMDEALAGVRLWITGLRRDQSAERRHTPLLQPQRGNLLKLHPIVDWPRSQVWAYLHRHDLPVHPLHARGYTSVGCRPCTRSPVTAADPRSGRWAGETRTECGLHTVFHREACARDGAA